MGTSGKHPGNCNRDLLNYIYSEYDIVRIATQKLDLRILKGQGAGSHHLEQAYLPPHYLFSYMYHYHRKEFFRRLVGPAGALGGEMTPGKGAQ